LNKDKEQGKYNIFLNERNKTKKEETFIYVCVWIRATDNVVRRKKLKKKSRING